MTNDNLYIRRKHEKKKVQISFISVKKIIRIVSEIFFISSGKITDGTITKAQLIYKSGEKRVQGRGMGGFHLLNSTKFLLTIVLLWSQKVSDDWWNCLTFLCSSHIIALNAEQESDSGV